MPKNNPTQPAVILEHGGLRYLLTFDFEAIAEAEDLTGRALLTGLHQKDVASPTISLVRHMLFACIHGAQPSLTFDQVKGFVNRGNLAAVWNKVLEAWTAGLAEPEVAGDDTEENPTIGQS